MKIISIISQKGGAGKTTLAINLALAAESQNKAAVIIDLDPQASASGWYDSRKEDFPVTISGQASRLENLLETAKKNGADYVFIDTAPHSESVALSAARFSDLVIIPCKPAILDLRAIKNTVDLLKLSNTKGVIVFNSAPPRGKIVEDATFAVKHYQVDVLDKYTIQRSAYIHSLTEGVGVIEYEPDGKAAHEIRDIFKRIKQILGAKDEK